MAGPGSKGVHITWKVSGVLVQIHGKTCLRTIHHLLMHPFGADGSKIWLFLCGLCYRRLLISQPYWCEAIRQKIAENGHFMAIFEPSGDGLWPKKILTWIFIGTHDLGRLGTLLDVWKYHLQTTHSLVWLGASEAPPPFTISAKFHRFSQISQSWNTWSFTMFAMFSFIHSLQSFVHIQVLQID